MLGKQKILKKSSLKLKPNLEPKKFYYVSLACVCLFVRVCVDIWTLWVPKRRRMHSPNDRFPEHPAINFIVWTTLSFIIRFLLSLQVANSQDIFFKQVTNKLQQYWYILWIIFWRRPNTADHCCFLFDVPMTYASLCQC